MTPTAENRATPLLLQPISVREITLRNRVVISPMCMYAAQEGLAGDFHLMHLGRFATGGAGLVIAEATAVQPDGRATHGDLGLWDDRQVAPLARVAAFLCDQGAVPGIQIGHAGRKGSGQRPYHGAGPIGASDLARGERPWQTLAPSPLPAAAGWAVPREMTLDDIARLRRDFASAAQRALHAGFQLLEIHAAHGYLLHTFLSPHTNQRTDAYGGSAANRMRLPLEVIEAVRERWPASLPLSVRISSVDDLEGGWSLDDSVALARKMKACGVDLVDCSSGGIAGSATASTVPRRYGFQLPYAERVRNDAGIATIAVGLIVDPWQAEQALQTGQADLIAIGRQALQDPNWALNAGIALDVDMSPDERFARWPECFAWWLSRRAKVLDRLGPWRSVAGLD
ncbi:MAG: NADH:flavin oxidoreductase/NADH oxidase [Ramlibacter sp.]|nr:NADH:flavin oxidoreductase/NADH oxidase [Ramlibacter sp.]